jgi:hypothetical protein
VKLINLDNLVLIGPGSEWFWSAVSAVVVAITLIAIYRQVRMQRSSAAIAQMDTITSEWSSERMARAYLVVLLAIEAGAEPARMPMGAMTTVSDFWEKVGYLTRVGHFDRMLVHRNLGLQVERSWARLRPTVVSVRADGLDVWADFEWLATTMVELDAKAGISNRLDDETLKASGRRGIEQIREELVAEEQLRTVPVRIVETSRAGS